MHQLRQWFVAIGLIAVIGVVASIIVVALTPDPTLVVTPLPGALSAPGDDGNAQPFDLDSSGLGDAPQAEATIAPPTPIPARQHTVVSGDTLFAIAQQYNTTVDALVAANALSNPNALDVGQVLIIPPE